MTLFWSDKNSGCYGNFNILHRSIVGKVEIDNFLSVSMGIHDFFFTEMFIIDDFGE